MGILVPRGRAPFGQHQEITTSGLVQRHSVFEWLCEHNILKPEPIRFVRLDSEHAQSDGKSVNRGLPLLDQARGRDFLVLTKRSAASGDENELWAEFVLVLALHAPRISVSWFTGFPPFTKNQLSKFQFDQSRGPA